MAGVVPSAESLLVLRMKCSFSSPDSITCASEKVAFVSQASGNINDKNNFVQVAYLNIIQRVVYLAITVVKCRVRNPAYTAKIGQIMLACNLEPLFDQDEKCFNDLRSSVGLENSKQTFSKR